MVTIFLIIQKLYFYIKETAVKFKYDREKSKYEKGYNSFLMGMVALANKDYKKAINETRKVSQYFKDDVRRSRNEDQSRLTDRDRKKKHLLYWRKSYEK